MADLPQLPPDLVSTLRAYSEPLRQSTRALTTDPLVVQARLEQRLGPTFTPNDVIREFSYRDPVLVAYYLELNNLIAANWLVLYTLLRNTPFPIAREIASIMLRTPPPFNTYVELLRDLVFPDYHLLFRFVLRRAPVYWSNPQWIHIIINLFNDWAKLGDTEGILLLFSLPVLKYPVTVVELSRFRFWELPRRVLQLLLPQANLQGSRFVSELQRSLELSTDEVPDIRELLRGRGIFLVHAS